jgi:nucleoside 2-deoxyribosyltransferase
MKLCLVGEVIVDVTLPMPGAGYKLRFGGIIHAARCAWALGIEYDLLFVSPAYLDEEVTNYARAHGAASVTRFGVVTGSPNVMLVGEATEAGNQQYENLLRDAYRCTLDVAVLDATAVANYTDILVIAGGYDLGTAISHLESSARLHVDIGSVPELELPRGSKRLATLFVSTSSPYFLTRSHRSVDELRAAASDAAEELVFKENRGGTRTFVGTKVISTPAHVTPVVHSVGVGDCFDVAVVVLSEKNDRRTALGYASMIAAEYGRTSYPDNFRTGVERHLALFPEDIADLQGISLPWEERRSINVYLAAPDFDYVDRGAIDAVVSALDYHNFRPRRPIQENGQATHEDSRARRREMCHADLSLLDECQLVVAVLPFDDPGTLIEIGWAAALGRPVIVYDADKRARNIMLTELPTLVSARLDDVIAEVFIQAARVVERQEP